MRRLSRLAKAGLLMVAMLATSVFAATAQDTANPAKDKQPIPWSSTCTSQGRSLPLECVLEQRAFVRESGQLIGLITIRVPSDTKQPVIMIQTPLGLFLPAGVTVDVDGDMAQNYPLQTCNAGGCYAGFPISEQLLNRMFNGGKLNVIFQYLDKKPFTLPMSLVGFTESYARIK